jgi:predicted permease
MSQIISMLLMIIISLAIGYIIKTLHSKEKIKLPFPIESIRRFLQRLTLIGFIPITVTTSVWIAPIRNLQIIALPFIGLTALAAGSLIALLFTKPLKLNRKQKAVFFVSGGFSNLGSLGSLIAFILLGEAGFALVSFYIFLERIWYFGVGFPYAKSHSLDTGHKESFNVIFKRMFIDPFVLATLLSMIAGTALNLFGVSRPDFFESINAFLVPFGSVLIFISIGMGMRLSAVKNYVKHGLIIVMIKALIIPMLIVSVSWLLGMGNVAGGLPLKVILILSAMPIGFTALVPPSIYDLDLDMANSCWLISNGALILIVPILAFLVPLI